jgi:hypothetical protein
MGNGSEFRGTVNRKELDPHIHQGISHLRCKRAAAINLPEGELFVAKINVPHTTYLSGFKISIAFGENAHCSRKGGMAHKAFDFVLSTDSRIFCELGNMGAAEGSWKDVGG